MEQNREIKQRELFDKFIEVAGIYLSKHMLNKLYDEIGPTKDDEYLMNYLVKNPKLFKYTLDHYSTLKTKTYSDGTALLHKYRRTVIASNLITGDVVEYESIYKAAKLLGKNKGHSNIYAAIITGWTCYGYKWKYK